MIQFWVLKRYFATKKLFFNITSCFAVLGMALGVGSLVVTMSVVSGYEQTLKSALTDYSGHLTIVRRGSSIAEDEDFIDRLPEMVSGFQAWTPFVQVEGMIAHNDKISGVVMSGLDPETSFEVLNLAHRVKTGTFDLSDKTGEEKVVVGIGVAKLFGLKVGDRFSYVRPMSSRKNSTRLFSKLQEFVVAGTIDLGKIEFNERLILAHVSVAQKLRPALNAYTGIKVRVTDRDLAPAAGIELGSRLGYPYVVSDWMDLNRNLLQAIRLEKPVIFLVVLIMVVAACFNVCSHLLVDVLKKYSDVSILRTMGASRKSLMSLFSFHGMMLGTVGIVLGLGLGNAMSGLVVWAQRQWDILPSTYKLEQIGTEISAGDLSLVALASLVICFLSTLPPAIRGARLNPVEGLKYE